MQILIAEDDETSRMILTAILKKKGYDVLVAQNGQEAIDLYDGMEKPALVILDWMMPHFTGVELVERFKQSEDTEVPYILLLTGRDKDRDLSYALNKGADDFIKKPYNPDEFWARLNVGRRTLDTQKALIKTQKELLYISEHDPMTGVFNRRAILEILKKEVQRLERTNTAFSVGMFDLDFFKKVNDTLGHAMGDEVICAFTRIVTENLREYDTFGRMGGEEFLLISPEGDGIGVNGVFERIRKAVEAFELNCEGKTHKFTVSVGALRARTGLSDKVILELVDEALYKAKDAGRNNLSFVSKGRMDSIAQSKIDNL